MAQEYVIIDEHLRFVFCAVEAALDVTIALDAREMDRVFRDARSAQVAKKEYCFYASDRLTVSGVVEEYEPESIILSVQGHRELERSLPRLVEKAADHARWFREFHGRVGL